MQHQARELKVALALTDGIPWGQKAGLGSGALLATTVLAQAGVAVIESAGWIVLVAAAASTCWLSHHERLLKRVGVTARDLGALSFASGIEVLLILLAGFGAIFANAALGAPSGMHLIALGVSGPICAVSITRLALTNVEKTLLVACLLWLLPAVTMTMIGPSVSATPATTYLSGPSLAVEKQAHHGMDVAAVGALGLTVFLIRVRR